MKALVLLVFLFSASFLFAADGDYAVSKINPALLKNANVVKRVEEESFSLKNPGEADYKLKYVLTILNENGDQYAGLTQYYSKFFDIKSIEGYLYDANGKELKKLKSKDIQDMSGVGDNSLMDDGRYKVHNFYYKVYPYTVAYEIEIKYNGTMFYPDWFPQSRSLLSVEQSRFTFSCPENYEFRYKAYQYSKEPIVAKEKGVKTYSWQISNLAAIVREPYSQGIRKIAPLVLLGPTDFEMQGYKGNMGTWQSLGKFVYDLKAGRDILPDNVKQDVHRIADGVTDIYKKIELLYNYMQKNTRYISIQLGIGGWQPFDAKFVAAKKYGDCKALSNYMYSLLKEAGIPSAYVVINAGDGEDDIFTDFPSSQFNHAILCVPVAKDTVWLECTDQDKSAGYMGGFTGNRHALMIDETGGKLVQTPKYGINENLQVRNIKATLDEDGSLQVKPVSRYTGIQQDDIDGLINHLSKEKVKEYLHEQLSFGTYEVNQFEYTQQKGNIPVINEVLDITVSNYANITGKRLFITPNIMTRSYRKPEKDSVRKYDINLSFAYKDIDTVEIQLPVGYTAEAMPAATSISSKFGKYSNDVKLKDNRLFYYRSIEHYSGLFPAADYKDLVQFYEAIYKADRQRVVLVKNETEKKAF